MFQWSSVNRLCEYTLSISGLRQLDFSLIKFYHWELLVWNFLANRRRFVIYVFRTQEKSAAVCMSSDDQNEVKINSLYWKVCQYTVTSLLGAHTAATGVQVSTREDSERLLLSPVLDGFIVDVKGLAGVLLCGCLWLRVWVTAERQISPVDMLDACAALYFLSLTVTVFAFCQSFSGTQGWWPTHIELELHPGNIILLHCVSWLNKRLPLCNHCNHAQAIMKSSYHGFI